MLGIAHIVRTGWFKAAFIKSEPCYRMRLLLTQRRNLKRKFLDIENTVRHSLKAFGISARLSPMIPLTRELMEAMLTARAALWKQYCKLHDLVVKFVSRSELCRRFMAIPGVGPVTALSFMTAIDDPSRFQRSRDVAAYFGLTSQRRQSGTSIDVQGRISKVEDPEMRRALYEAAGVMLTRFKGKDKLKAWGLMLPNAVVGARRPSPSPAKWRSSCTRCGATAPSMSATPRRVKPMSPRARPSKTASFSARTHDAARRKHFADDRAKRARLLSKGAPRKR